MLIIKKKKIPMLIIRLCIIFFCEGKVIHHLSTYKVICMTNHIKNAKTSLLWKIKCIADYNGS